MTHQINTTLLEKYFPKWFNPKYSYSDLEWKIQRGSDNPETQNKYQQIKEFCTEYQLQKYEDVFVCLFHLSWQVMFRQESSIIEKESGKVIEDYENIKYKKEMFPMFMNILRTKMNRDYRIESLSIKASSKQIMLVKKEKFSTEKVPKYDFEPEEYFKISNEIFIDQFQDFILDTVSSLFFQGKKWDELSDEDLTIIVNGVEDWINQFREGEAGAKNKTHFRKEFVKDIKAFIDTEIGNIFFPSENQYFLFAGRLFIIFGIPLETKGKDPAEMTNEKIIQNIKNLFKHQKQPKQDLKG